MFFSILCFVVLALASFPDCTYAQTVYTWPGPIRVPVDRRYIANGTVTIQLSNNATNRRLLIRERVIVTFDCTPRVEAVKKIIQDDGGGRLHNVSWYVRFIDFKGELGNERVVVSTTPPTSIIYDIFGDNMEFLRADGSTVPSQAKQGGYGIYRCEVCYDNKDGVSSCNSSKISNEVIGDPPVVNIGKPNEITTPAVSTVQVFIGTDFCVMRNDPFILHNIVCSHNESFPVLPEPEASYYRNGVPVGATSPYVAITDNSYIGLGNVLVIAEISIPFEDVLGNYTCALFNLYGTSTATTIVTECCDASNFPIIRTSTGFITSPTENSIDVGASTCYTSVLKIQCSVSANATVNITWTKDGQHVDEYVGASEITVSGPGVYICRASTRCGSAEATSIVLGTQPVIDSGTGVVISPTSEVKVGQSVCLSASGSGSSVDLVCYVTMGSQFTTFKWTTTSNPSTVLSSNETLTVTDPNSYKCTAESPCGSSSVISVVNRFIDISLTGSVSGGNKCSQLKTPPSGVDVCPFVGDNLTLTCTTNAPLTSGTIYPVSSIVSIGVSDGGIFHCNASNVCGTSRSDLIVQVFDPAQIDRTSLLPPTSPTKIVAGAGRTNQSISVRNGNTIELHCPYSGTEKPSTTWYRVGPSGVLMSVNSSIPDVTIIDASNDLILTFSSFTPSLAGTYRCVTTNNAGDDEGNVILKTLLGSDGMWSTSLWSNCSKPCGGGIRTRSLTCISENTGAIIDDSQCAPLPKPATFEYCNTDPCCDKDLYPPYCKLIAGTDRCQALEYKEACCCTCHYY